MSVIQLNRATLDALHGVLEEEIRQYEAAVQVLTRKKEMLVSGKPQALGQIDRELLALGQKAGQLEKQRQLIMQSMGCTELTLEKLMLHMEPGDVRIFSVTRERLLRAMQDSARLNQESRDLLDLALRWIRDTVELIADALTPDATSYDAQGGKVRRAGAAPSGETQSTITHSA
ncbi:MAG TPA: flagellar export chaperone FlgN [Coleofasciculaceae cyanobacterium]|jgi:hypothetical protein